MTDLISTAGVLVDSEGQTDDEILRDVVAFLEDTSPVERYHDECARRAMMEREHVAQVARISLHVVDLRRQLHAALYEFRPE